jgi:glycosyltransferase involved in cell wall biosynthesis
LTGPCISVVVPTRHRNEQLAALLDRLAPGAQELPADRYEVIVTDDGSATTAAAMVRDRFPWAKWAAGPCRGPAANRNSGVRHARHDYVAFTDDDCLPSAAWLAAYAHAIVPETPIYEGRTVCSLPITSPLWGAPVNQDGGWLWSCNMMVRRDAFEALGGFDEDYPLPHMEDSDFRERARALRLPFAWVPDAVVDHPPRRLPTGAKLGAEAECEVIFWYKHRRPGSAARYLVPYIAKGRVKWMLRHRPGVDTVHAAASLVAEMAFVVRHIGRWDAMYRERYGFPTLPPSTGTMTSP